MLCKQQLGAFFLGILLLGCSGRQVAEIGPTRSAGPPPQLHYFTELFRVKGTPFCQLGEVALGTLTFINSPPSFVHLPWTMKGEPLLFALDEAVEKRLGGDLAAELYKAARTEPALRSTDDASRWAGIEPSMIPHATRQDGMAFSMQVLREGIKLRAEGRQYAADVHQTRMTHLFNSLCLETPSPS